MQQRNYGWKKNDLDPRDFAYKLTASVPLVTTNNRTKYFMPDIRDQGQEGSCTGFGWSGFANYLYMNGHVSEKVEKLSPVPFSPQFLYYNERVQEGTVTQDAGAQIRTGAKVFNKMGICRESTFPYHDTEVTKRPSPAAYKEALNFTIPAYQSLDNSSLAQLVHCLTTGIPFVFGMLVYPEFESAQVAKTGILPMPNLKNKPLGGHCMWCIDYNLQAKGFWVVNSWGKKWGKNGLVFIPQSYLTDTKLCSDFTTALLMK